MQSNSNLPVIGLHLAKSVFQLHIVDPESGEIERRQIKRARLTEFLPGGPVVWCIPQIGTLTAISHYGQQHRLQN
jgi:hypothetical protein